ncbi:MAG: DUF2089 domain-containing protein [Candidatus Limnocylindrales bacterium]
MAHDVISVCPVCTQELSVTRLHCRSCGTTLDGDFRVGRFGRLTREQLELLESFLRSRGNLREMERESGLSYPTLRGRVDALIHALGLGEPPIVGAEPSDGATLDSDPPAPTDAPTTSAPADARREILERLARHELHAPEAAALLRSAGTSGSTER